MTPFDAHPALRIPPADPPGPLRLGERALPSGCGRELTVGFASVAMRIGGRTPVRGHLRYNHGVTWSEHRDLWVVRALSFSLVGLAFPVGAFAVFGAGADRNATADILAVCYATGLMAGISSAMWPLPSVRGRTWHWRVESTCAVFLLVSYATHLSWELGWLAAHDQIIAARDSAWAYPWWAYIDGGDLRYAAASPDLLVMEALSVINGAVGVCGVVLWRRTNGQDRRAVLLFAATAVVHLYSVALYYGAEIVAGLPNVDTTSVIDTWIKFGLANAPWAIFPWFVLYAAGRRLTGEERRGRVAVGLASDERG